MNENKKPQMHQSALASLAKCGEAFRRRYLEHERHPFQSYMHVGRGIDEAANQNLQNKIDNAELLPVDQVTETARAVTRKSIEEDGIIATPEETGLSDRAITTLALDKASRLTFLHATKIAPVIQPLEVQGKFAIELPGASFDVVGTWDLRDVARRIRDLKSSKKTPSKTAAEESDKLTTYALADHVVNKTELPIAVALDTMVDLKTGPKAVTLESSRDGSDLNIMLNRYYQADTVIQLGAFMPANQDAWWCSLAYCEFAHDCKFFRHPKSFVLEEGN
jgi:hypothetical protein